jgi:hypothetical protein
MLIPVTFVMIAGTFETGRYIQKARQVQQTAVNVGRILSQTAGPFSDNDLTLARNTVYLSIPDIATKTKGDTRPVSDRVRVNLMAVDITMAPFCAPGTSCSIARPNWVSSDSERNCDQLSLSATALDYDPGKLPVGMRLNAGSVLVVDVIYNYQPIVGASFIPGDAFRMVRSAYFDPRHVSTFTLSNASGNVAQACN